MATLQQETEMFNASFYEALDGGEMGFTKMAADINSYIRTTMREEGISRRIITLQPLGYEELNPQLSQEEPFKIIYKEPNNPPAMSVPFGTSPLEANLLHGRAPCYFERIVGPRFVKDVILLRTTPHDVRQIVTDNSVKDMMAEEDTKFLAAINTALGTRDATSPFVPNTVMYKSAAGGFTRNNLVIGKQIMSQSPYHLSPVQALINNTSWMNYETFNRTEAGGDLSQELLLKGNGNATYLGLDWRVTIKRDLVPDNRIYFFADEKFIGKFYSLEDITLWCRKQFFMVDWFPYECNGMCLAHLGGIAALDML